MGQKLGHIWAILLLTELFVYSTNSLSIQAKPELGNIIYNQNIEASAKEPRKEEVLPTLNKVRYPVVVAWG